MPLFGAHMSIAGGLHKAIESADAHGMETLQLFTASPQNWSVKQVAVKTTVQWLSKPFVEEDVEQFKKKLRTAKLKFATAHDSYLINLASQDEALFRRSVEAFVVELQRAEQLGLTYLVTHPGAHMGAGDAAGIERVASAIDEVHGAVPNSRS